MVVEWVPTGHIIENECEDHVGNVDRRRGALYAVTRTADFMKDQHWWLKTDEKIAVDLSRTSHPVTSSLVLDSRTSR